jgi:hypothetical protein
VKRHVDISFCSRGLTIQYHLRARPRFTLDAPRRIFHAARNASWIAASQGQARHNRPDRTGYARCHTQQPQKKKNKLHDKKKNDFLWRMNAKVTSHLRLATDECLATDRPRSSKHCWINRWCADTRKRCGKQQPGHIWGVCFPSLTCPSPFPSSLYIGAFLAQLSSVTQCTPL